MTSQYRRVVSRGELRIELVDYGLDRVHLLEVHAQQEAVVAAHGSGQRIDERLLARLAACVTEFDEFRRIVCPTHDRGKDLTPHDAHHVGQDARELDVGVLEDLVDSLDGAGLLVGQLFARPREVAYRLDRRRRHETRLDEPVGEQTSAVHSASFTSVLRPGTFLMCRALTRISFNEPSRMFQIGFQNTPVDSIAAASTPWATR